MSNNFHRKKGNRRKKANNISRRRKFLYVYIAVKILEKMIKKGKKY